MIVTLENGREVELSVCGKYEDDIQIAEANYTDAPFADVADKDLDYIMNNYENEIYEAWWDKRITDADFYVCDLND